MPRKIDDVIRRIKKRFDQDPEDWRVYGGRDQRGNSDIFIQQHPHIWQIKLKPVDPFRNIAFGSPARRLDDEINEKINGKPGTRPDDLLRLFNMMVPISSEENVVASGIEQFSQSRAKDIREHLQEKNPNQEKGLQQEVEREFEKKFPGRSALFT
ncbi:MAG: hypothetical protein ACTSU5_20005 [Promethearchaeota archaeon]